MSSLLKLLGALATFLHFLVDELRRAQHRKEQKDAQDSYDAIEHDPVGEFNKRFSRSGVPSTAAPKSTNGPTTTP